MTPPRIIATRIVDNKEARYEPDHAGSYYIQLANHLIKRNWNQNRRVRGQERHLATARELQAQS